jgi:hypothetical protein
VVGEQCAGRRLKLQHGGFRLGRRRECHPLDNANLVAFGLSQDYGAFGAADVETQQTLSITPHISSLFQGLPSIRGNQMNLGGQTATGFANGLRAVFFNAPVPSGCTFTMVLSNDNVLV